MLYRYRSIAPSSWDIIDVYLLVNLKSLKDYKMEVEISLSGLLFTALGITGTIDNNLTLFSWFLEIHCAILRL